MHFISCIRVESGFWITGDESLAMVLLSFVRMHDKHILIQACLVSRGGTCSRRNRHEIQSQNLKLRSPYPEECTFSTFKQLYLDDWWLILRVWTWYLRFLHHKEESLLGDFHQWQVWVQTYMAIRYMRQEAMCVHLATWPVSRNNLDIRGK